MPEPSAEQLHAALSRSFIRPERAARRGRGQLLSLAETLRVLREDLELPGDQRTRRPIPRVVHSVALWNLALPLLQAGALAARDRAELDALVTAVFGRSLAEIDAMRRQRIDPLLLLARPHKIDNYRWALKQGAGGAVTATLELVLQYPLEQLRAVLDPTQWAKRCELLWGTITPVAAPEAQRATKRFEAILNLPGPRARATAVRLEATPSTPHFGFANKFRVTVDGHEPAPPLLLCEGSIKAEKEEGDPWVTRITHTKVMSADSVALIEAAGLDVSAEDTLPFWLQAETVCLVVPH